MAKCCSNNGYEKDMCSKEFRLRAQHIKTILNLIINIVKEWVWEEESNMTMRIYTLIMSNIFI